VNREGPTTNGNGKPRGMPVNDEAETGLLGCLFITPEALNEPEVSAIEPHQLFDPFRQIVWRHLVEAIRDGNEPSVLPARITAAGQWSDEVKAVVLEAARYGGTGHDARAFADMLRREYERRKLLQFQAELRRQIDDRLPPEDVRGFLAAFLDSAPNGSTMQPLAIGELERTHSELHPGVVNGLLRIGEVGNFVSAPKIGKSWLGYSLALSVAAGLPWLGRFTTRQGRVLLIDNELTKPVLANRIPRVAAALGIEPHEYHPHFDVISLRGQLRDIYQLRPMLTHIKPGEYSLVLLDALYRLWPERMSETDNNAVAAVMNCITGYAERMQAAFALVHHSSKGNQAGKSVVDVGSGASAMARAADAHVALREHAEDGAVVLEAKTRSWESPQPLALRWEFPLWVPDTDLDPGDLRQMGGGKKPKGNEFVERVYDLIPLHAVTRNFLRTSTGASGGRVNDAIQLLLEEGRIAEEEVVTAGGKFPGFRRNQCQQFTRVDRVDKGGQSNVSRGGMDTLPEGKRVRPPHPDGTRAGSMSTPARFSEFDEFNESEASE
jgi:hypothetical protein